MSLRPTPVPPVPAATAQLAQQVFPRGHLYLTMRDTFETFFTDALFFFKSFDFMTAGATVLLDLGLAVFCQFRIVHKRNIFGSRRGR